MCVCVRGSREGTIYEENMKIQIVCAQLHSTLYICTLYRGCPLSSHRPKWILITPLVNASVAGALLAFASQLPIHIYIYLHTITLLLLLSSSLLLFYCTIILLLQLARTRVYVEIIIYAYLYVHPHCHHRPVTTQKTAVVFLWFLYTYTIYYYVRYSLINFVFLRILVPQYTVLSLKTPPTQLGQRRWRNRVYSII